MIGSHLKFLISLSFPLSSGNSGALEEKERMKQRFPCTPYFGYSNYNSQTVFMKGLFQNPI